MDCPDCALPPAWHESISRNAAALVRVPQPYDCGDLRQPIPSIPVPLDGEVTLTLALQPLLHRVYDRARFGLAIDYGQPLTPQLSEADAAWLAELVQPDSPTLTPA